MGFSQLLFTFQIHATFPRDAKISETVLSS